MGVAQAAVLALIQALADFLPLPASAHRLLISFAGDWPEPGPAFLVAVHLGALAGALVFFREDLAVMSAGWVQALKSRIPNDDARLAWAVLLGCLPLELARLLSRGAVEARFGAPVAVASATLLFGLLLGWAGARARQLRCEYCLRTADIVAVACAQVLALAPGVSRPGIALTVGLLMGLDRGGAARFAALLSMPAVLLLCAHALLRAEGPPVSWSLLAVGAGIGAPAAWLGIRALLWLLDRVGVWPVVVWQVVVGSLALWRVAGG